MRLKSIFALLLPVILMTACSPMRYSQYTGKAGIAPAGLWPVGEGTMAETSYGIPVYRGWPEREYQVLGSIRFEDPNKYWDDGIIHMAANMGKEQGGDAIVIRHGSEFGVGKFAGFPNDPAYFVNRRETTALVIRWLSESESQIQRERNRQFLLKFTAEHQDVTANQEVSELVIRFLLQIGTDVNSQEFRTKFNETMLKVVAKPADTISGHWIYKGSLITSSLTSQGDQVSFLGTADVSLDGENVAIISDAGTVEINFNGTLARGRLSGQLGIGSFSTKSEGAALHGKLSLSFQSTTPEGVVRGNVVFQRLQLKSNPITK